jgi:hypothetical protein
VKIHSRKKKGLAIITTLMILGLLLALLGAFITVNRAGNQFTQSTIKSRAAQDIALAAAAYVQTELEKDRNWGNSENQFPAGTSPEIVGPLDITSFSSTTEVSPNVVGLIEGRYSSSGNFSSPEGTFTIEIRNQLGEPNPLSTSVPGRTAEIVVNVTLDNVNKQLRMLLRDQAKNAESVAAGGNINLDDAAGLIRIESLDPYANRIAASGDLNLPNASDVQFLKHGVAASGGQLNVGGVNLAGATPDTLVEKGEESNGVYSPNAAHIEVKEIEDADLSLPTNVSSVAGGTWTFGDITHQQYRPQTINFSEVIATPPDSPPIVNNGSFQRYQRRTSLYNVLTSPSGQQWAAGTAIPDSAGEWYPPEPTGALGSEDAAATWGFDESTGGFGDSETTLPTSDVHEIAPGLKANVVTAQFAVRSGYTIEASGAFVVVGSGDRQPEMYFGYDLTPGGVAQQESLNGGLLAAQENPATYMGALKASGDIDVTGGVLGYGSMISGGQLTIKASSGLRTAPALGVVVKGNRIVVNPATEPEPTLPGEPVDSDFPIYRDAIQAESGGDWSSYDGWLEHDRPARESIVTSLGSTSTGLSASSVWSTLNAEVGGGGSFPGAQLTANGWPSGNLTVDQYARLKEYYQTVATGYNDGAGIPEWLNLSLKQEDVNGRITATLNNVAQWAESYQKSFQEYLANPAPDIPQMYMEGIVYAEEDIIINANGNSVKLKGSVVARNGDVTINGADTIDLVYDRTLVDDLSNGSPTPGEKRPLERVFFSIF